MHLTKLQPTYLDGPINNRVDEKGGALVSAIIDQSAPEASSIDVLEVGPGGGVGLEGIANAHLPADILSRLNIVTLELFASDSVRLRQATEMLRSQGASVTSVIGSMSAMPFKSDAFNVISASAVLHEVFSYGKTKHSVRKAIAETAESLKPGGLFVYRDVYGVEDSLLSPFTQAYASPSWKTFIHRFLPYFLDNAQHPYDTTSIVEHPTTDGVTTLTMPRGLARDLQRHYITFRDHLWRSHTLGVWPTEESLSETLWLNETRYIKKVYFETDDSSGLEGMPVDSDVRGRFIDGISFDNLTDSLIAQMFHDSPSDSSPAIETAFEEWLEREGGEVYIYTSPKDMVELAAAANKNAPLTTDGVTLHPRSYYSHYLHNKLGSGALVDAKLAITFKKTTQPKFDI